MSTNQWLSLLYAIGAIMFALAAGLVASQHGPTVLPRGVGVFLEALIAAWFGARAAATWDRDR